jgi:hypothetical protein
MSEEARYNGEERHESGRSWGTLLLGVAALGAMVIASPALLAGAKTAALSLASAAGSEGAIAGAATTVANAAASAGMNTLLTTHLAHVGFAGDMATGAGLMNNISAVAGKAGTAISGLVTKSPLLAFGGTAAAATGATALAMSDNKPKVYGHQTRRIVVQRERAAQQQAAQGRTS